MYRHILDAAMCGSVPSHGFAEDPAPAAATSADERSRHGLRAASTSLGSLVKRFKATLQAAY